MEFIQELFSTILIIVGAIFIMIAAIGIIRLPDFYVRMSAITKAGTMGVGFIAVGIAIYFNDLAIATKAFVIISFMLITAPVAAHIIARAAYRQGIPFWGQNLVDELDVIVKKRDTLEELTVAEPSNIKAKIDLVECYSILPPIMGGSLKKAVLVASDIKDIDEAEGSRMLGLIYARDREYKLAEQEFLSAVTASNGSVKYRYELAWFYRDALFYNKALSVLDEILHENPTEIEALFEYGKTSAESSLMFETGQHSLINYIDKLPETEKNKIAEANYYMGLIKFKRNKYSLAKEYFEKALEQNPEHHDAKFYLSKL